MNHESKLDQIVPEQTKRRALIDTLAQYDSNGDGKIDANDPIWSQLKVWQYDRVDECNEWRMAA